MNTDYVNYHLHTLEKCLKTFESTTSAMKEYNHCKYQYLSLRFESIVNNVTTYNASIDHVIDELIALIETLSSVKSKNKNKVEQQKIDLFIRCGSYLMNFNHEEQHAMTYYQQAVDLAEQEVNKQSSRTNRCQLAHAILQQSQARVRADCETGKFIRSLNISSFLHV
jgi:hypothetical protein